MRQHEAEEALEPLLEAQGERLPAHVVGDGAIPAAFRLTKSVTSPNGTLIATYERAGDVATGSFAMEQPTDAELERRRRLGETG